MRASTDGELPGYGLRSDQWQASRVVCRVGVQSHFKTGQVGLGGAHLACCAPQLRDPHSWAGMVPVHQHLSSPRSLGVPAALRMCTVRGVSFQSLDNKGKPAEGGVPTEAAAAASKVIEALTEPGKIDLLQGGETLSCSPLDRLKTVSLSTNPYG